MSFISLVVALLVLPPDPALSQEKNRVANRINDLADADPDVRLDSIQALERIGADARSALPALLKALTDKNASIRSNVLNALYAIDMSNPQVLAAFCKALKDEDEDVRREAAEGLEAMGPPAKGAVPDLVRALEDETIRGRAAAALWKIEPGHPLAIPALIKDLKDNRSGLARSEAARILKSLGPHARTAVLPLCEALKDPHMVVCCCCADALGAIGPEARAALPALAAASKDPRRLLRHFATDALIRIDPDNETGVQALIGVLMNRDSNEQLAIRLGDRENPAGALGNGAI